MNFEPWQGLCELRGFAEHEGMGLKGGVGYPSDVTDEEWAFVLPYLLLCREDSPQRKYEMRAVFNAVRYVARTGGQWRFLPNDMPPWHVVYQQMQRWLKWGCFQMLVEDVRSLLREWGGRKGQPTAVVIDSRTLQSTPESGARAGHDGAKRRKSMVCDWKWSSIQPPNEASCCCRGGGWPSGASAGLRASAGWHATTNVSTPHSKVSTCSPLPASCSETSPIHSDEVHNSL